MHYLQIITLALLLAGSGLHSAVTIQMSYADDYDVYVQEEITEESAIDLRELLWMDDEYGAVIGYYEGDTDPEVSLAQTHDSGLRVLLAMMNEVNCSGDAWAYLRGLKVNDDDSLEITAVIIDESGEWELTQVVPRLMPDAQICL